MKYRAILVDDDPYALERMAYLLEEYNDIEIIARETNASKALMRIKSLHPDVLFLDIEMPGGSGLEMVDALKEDGIHVPVVYITAYEQYAIQALRQEAVDYLVKPVDVTELRKAIERMRKILPQKKSTQIILSFTFTPRDMEILKFLARGLSSKEIAEMLFLSPHTIDTYRRRMLKKAGVRNTAELIALFADQSTLI